MCAGRQFHASTTLCEKQCLRISSLALGFPILYLCPLDCLLLMWKNMLGVTFTSPFIILNTSIRSPLLHRFSSLMSQRFFKRSSNGNDDLIILLTLFPRRLCPSLYIRTLKFIRSMLASANPLIAYIGYMAKSSAASPMGHNIAFFRHTFDVMLDVCMTDNLRCIRNYFELSETAAANVSVASELQAMSATSNGFTNDEICVMLKLSASNDRPVSHSPPVYLLLMTFPCYLFFYFLLFFFMFVLLSSAYLYGVKTFLGTVPTAHCLHLSTILCIVILSPKLAKLASGQFVLMIHPQTDTQTHRQMQRQATYMADFILPCNNSVCCEPSIAVQTVCCWFQVFTLTAVASPACTFLGRTHAGLYCRVAS